MSSPFFICNSPHMEDFHSKGISPDAPGVTPEDTGTEGNLHEDLNSNERQVKTEGF